MVDTEHAAWNEVLRAARIERGMTYKELARATNGAVTDRGIAGWEAGDVRKPRLDALIAVGRVLGTDLAGMVYNEGNDPQARRIAELEGLVRDLGARVDRLAAELRKRPPRR